MKIEDYDFFDICDLSRSGVEFQNSRYILDDGPAVTLATSTPYKSVLAQKSIDESSFDINDDSVHFHVPELVFNEISSHAE